MLTIFVVDAGNNTKVLRKRTDGTTTKRKRNETYKKRQENDTKQKQDRIARETERNGCDGFARENMLQYMQHGKKVMFYTKHMSCASDVIQFTDDLMVTALYSVEKASWSLGATPGSR